MAEMNNEFDIKEIDYEVKIEQDCRRLNINPPKL